jgi:lysyl-tRNA synthetase, class I
MKKMVQRLYDEWDTLLRQVEKGTVNEVNRRAFERATRITAGEVSYTHHPVPFHLLTSVLDVTQAKEEQVVRIVSQHLPESRNSAGLRSQLEPRFTCALNWITRYLPDDERTTIRMTFNAEAYATFSEMDKASLTLLTSEIDQYWTLNGLTELMYRIPKIVRGLPVDATPTDELKRAQRTFFVAIYTLICNSDTGPRIPTLLLSIGLERAKLL